MEIVAVVCPGANTSVPVVAVKSEPGEAFVPVNSLLVSSFTLTVEVLAADKVTIKKTDWGVVRPGHCRL